ncbi:acyltransferase family protein [Methylomonas koyamae]|uniref:acyltransferase family protein n=1 Tax=Methylomonas koyamae TaxID=702114 RepID=UPI0028737A91|nr:acyltransferase [Methylomonas koyamae]WNB77827.1 acyltransferase [Methylomonas koyamae]
MMGLVGFDDPVGPVPAVASLLTALLTAALLHKRFGVSANQGRYASIDGLRGFLAFLVFIHHSAVWYFYLKTGHWTSPPSNLYVYFGQGSVGFFFMITGFLFFSKLLEGRHRPVDWLKLLVSRVLRLLPMYLFAIGLLLLIVYFVSGGVLNDPMPILLKNIVRWVGFTIKSAPDLNGVKQTYIIVAGVFWSLPYEWLFYLSLPILSLAVLRIPPLPYLLISLFCLGVFVYIGRIKPELLLPFFGGIAGSFLVRLNVFCRYAAKTALSPLVVAFIAGAVVFYDSAWEAGAVFLLSSAFVLIAAGNTLFGILIHPVSRVLGEMAYSIYLLHGMVLYVLFNFVVGSSAATEFLASVHWLWIVGITPIVVLLSFATFHWIEAPAMRATPWVTVWLRSKITIFSKEAAQ